MRSLHLFAALALTACGADDSKSESAPVQVQATAPKPDPEPTDEPAPDLFVDAAGDLAPCNADNAGRLVYAAAEAIFYHCEPTGQWSPIDLKGEGGPAGDKGQAGAQGPKGDKGDPGADGLPGEDGDVATDSMWWDPVALRWWTFTNATTPFAVAQASCVAPWRLPTAEEFILAQARGLRVVATANFEAWLQDGTHVRYDGQTLAGAAAPYCVEEVTP